MPASEVEGLPESRKTFVPDGLLAKKKELEKLKNRALEKNQELRDLETALAQKEKQRNAEIEESRKELGTGRQSWMTAEKH